jgi:hypothetical protein
MRRRGSGILCCRRLFRRCSGGEFGQRFGMCLGVITGITTESSEFRASGGNCGLVVVWIGSSRSRSISAGGMFRNRRGSESCFFAEGSGGTVGVGFAFQVDEIVHRELSDKEGRRVRFLDC